MQFDHIVVGGGTAGTVIASRLSEERERRVLLLEAGPDYSHSVPSELMDASFAVLLSHNWDMQAIVGEADPAATGQRERVNKVFQAASSFLPSEEKLQQPLAIGQLNPFPYTSAKVIGGGSAINGCLALHARPEDYAAWSRSGFSDWNWEQVHPYMDRIATADKNKPPLPLETASFENLTLCQKAFLKTCHALGHHWVDLCQAGVPGVGTIPRNVSQGRRVSTAALYLAQARGRDNLIIRSGCLVHRLLLEKEDGTLRAIGIEALINGERRRFFGGHITVSAGAINSPAILLRSGIGAAEQVARSNIKPILDLPGVGKNLQDHSSVTIWAIPKTGSCVAGEPVHQLMLQQRSTTSEMLCDIQLYMLSSVRTRDVPGLHAMAGSDLALGVSAVLATPRSRGHVQIVDDDPTKNPSIHLHCLQEPEDLHRMMEATRSAWCILRREPLNHHIERFLLWTQTIIDSDVLLERLIRSTVRTTWHPAGTLRMGKEEDDMAVVDQCGRLYGCRNVTVADASIIPVIPSVPLNLTCMLIGERISAHLRGLEPKVSGTPRAAIFLQS